MRKSNFILKTVMAMMPALLFFTSCINDPEPPVLDANADVFIQKITEDGESKTALAFWVLGNKALDSVIVAGPDKETWTLQRDPSTSQVFNRFPENEDYTNSSPETGTYNFSVSSKQDGDESIVVADKLGEEELGAMLIDTVGFKNSKLEVKWDTLEHAEAFMVRLYTDANELIFVGEKQNDKATSFSFGVDDKGWSTTKAETGKTYRLEVVGIRYETGATAMNRDYNVQYISMASTSLVWGE